MIGKNTQNEIAQLIIIVSMSAAATPAPLPRRVMKKSYTGTLYRPWSAEAPTEIITHAMKYHTAAIPMLDFDLNVTLRCRKN